MNPTGLTSQEAQKRLTTFGPNQIVQGKKISGLLDFLTLFTNPLILILLFASIISYSLGDTTSAIIIITIVLASASLDFINTYKSEQAAEKLKAKVMVTATVVRDGASHEIPLSFLVPGDIVMLVPGDIVPADCKVVAAKTFFVNESSLTGESIPVEKIIGDSIFMGSNIVTGDATAEVIETGKNTKFSGIAASLIHADVPTEFDRSMKDFSLLVMKVTLALVLFIFLINALNKHDVLNSFLFAVALAVGLTPELLPLIITLNLTKGSLELAKNGVIVKKLSAIQNFGSMDILCTDKTGTLTEDKIALVRWIDGSGKESDDVLLYSYLSSAFTGSHHNPLDMAVKEHAAPDISGYIKKDETPFDYQYKRNTVAVEKDDKVFLISKGSPEAILEVCSSSADGAAKDTFSTEALAQYHALSQDGFRVLGVALKEVPQKADYTREDEEAMTFLGFIAFLDPARASATETLKKLEQYGIEIKILTGDNDLVSKKIAHDINLPVKGILIGSDIEHMTDAALRIQVEQTTIFASISPDQKKRIITTLQNNKHVVGFMGDGINDAPSLKAADVGISVNNAVDVAKEAADLILLKKSLIDLIEGVVSGRKTFINTLKYLLVELSSNFGNMFSMAGASIFLPFLPMLPTQILFNNLVYDTSQFAIPLDNVDEESIQRPIKFDMRFIKRFMLVFGLLSSVFDFITFFILFFVLHFSEYSFQTGWFLESIATQSLVVFLIRTKKIPFTKSNPSVALIFSMMFTVLIGWGIVFLPLGTLLHFVPLPPAILGLVLIITFFYLIIVEMGKRVFYDKMKTSMF